MLSVSPTVRRRMIERLMNDKLEVVVPCLKYYPSILPERLRKTTDNRTVDSRCPERDPSRTPPEYKSHMIPPKPRFSVNPDQIVHYRVYGLLAITSQTRRNGT
jgi:hypothetical protein